jgi:hypothetical protein
VKKEEWLELLYVGYSPFSFGKAQRKGTLFYIGFGVGERIMG